jgi:hypothetical protein
MPTRIEADTSFPEGEKLGAMKLGRTSAYATCSPAIIVTTRA